MKADVFINDKGVFQMEEEAKILEHIETIKKHYPPENYTMLRETLDYCVSLLKEKIEK